MRAWLPIGIVGCLKVDVDLFAELWRVDLATSNPDQNHGVPEEWPIPDGRKRGVAEGLSAGQ